VPIALRTSTDDGCVASQFTDMMRDMNPSQKPLSESPTRPSGNRKGNPQNVVPGIKEGQQRGPDGRMLPKGQVPLTEEVQDVLTAMQHVYTKATTSDRTHQQRNLRAMKDANPIGFYDRMTELETNSASHNGQHWDGTSACPTCKRPPGQIDVVDTTPEAVELLIDELLAADDEQ
jgi:hypothetical protein